MGIQKPECSNQQNNQGGRIERLMDGYETAAEIAKALGHPVRLQILQALRYEEACVCHLEAALHQRQAYISQQLMRLRDAGLVIDRRDGMNVYYSLADEHIVVLLDTVQEAATRLTQSNKLSVAFAPPEDCPCPKCQQTVAAYPGR
jgi:DNA-binding transcriptional ArsR family regulator